ncbi:hypothetical protein [Celeribacter sp.]|uniref:hypothetical protein n=1 Tax=Celeribacter sp. TaxID=1890673 RepID=UPI003A90D023
MPVDKSTCPEMTGTSLRITWRGIGVQITLHPRRWGSPVDHIEIESDGREPLPITETGYRSNFILAGTIPSDELERHVLAWLEEQAQTDGWKQYEAERRQLSLF